VSSITFIVSEGKFDRLIYKLTTVTNYTKPTRFILRVLDCQKLCIILYGCLSFALFIIDNIKCNFLEFIVFFVIVSNTASVKLHLKYYKDIHDI